MSSAQAGRRLTWRVVAVRLAALCVIGLLGAGWIAQLRQAGADTGVLQRDWTAFHRAGRLLLDGSVREIYPGSFDTQYPYLYPPFAIWVCVPLGVLPGVWAYGLIVAIDIVALVLCIRVLRGWLPGRPGEYATAALVVLASAPWNGVVVVGQITPLLVLVLVTAFGAWRGGRPVKAGLLLSLLLVKPNIGVVAAGVALLRGGRRLALGLLLGASALLLSTLPLGWDVWRDWYDASMRMSRLVAGHDVDLWKHQTMFAFWWTVLGRHLEASYVRLVWAISIVPLGVGLGLVWWRAWDPQRLARLLGVTVLFLIAANPYAYFYDGLLLMIPAIVWQVRTGEYAIPVCSRVAAICLAAIFAWQHLSLFVFKAGAPLALTGACVYVWFVVEVLDLLAAGRSGQAA